MKMFFLSFVLFFAQAADGDEIQRINVNDIEEAAAPCSEECEDALTNRKAIEGDQPFCPDDTCSFETITNNSSDRGFCTCKYQSGAMVASKIAVSDHYKRVEQQDGSYEIVYDPDSDAEQKDCSQQTSPDECGDNICYDLDPLSKNSKKTGDECHKVRDNIIGNVQECSCSVCVLEDRNVGNKKCSNSADSVDKCRCKQSNVDAEDHVENRVLL